MTMIGAKIRNYRKEKGWTQRQLGEACGINEANIRKYELGKQNPKLETLTKIATALGINMYVLLDGTYEALDLIFPSQNQNITPNDTDTSISAGLKEYNKKFLQMTQEQIKTSKEAIETRTEYLLKSLNEAGQEKAVELLELLSKVPEYQK